MLAVITSTLPSFWQKGKGLIFTRSSVSHILLEAGIKSHGSEGHLNTAAGGNAIPGKGMLLQIDDSRDD